jgi:hypothetical protein
VIFRSFLLLLLLMVGSLLVAPQPAVGGDVIHTTCGIGALNGSYNGEAMFVLSSSGNINGFCHFTLTAGEPVAEPIRLTLPFPTPFGLVYCDAEFSPSGHGHMQCHS